MCCRRRQARNPLVVTAGRTICNAYQDRQTTRQIQDTAPPPPNMARNTHSHQDQISGEIMKRAGIDPPPYTPVVMNRAVISGDPPRYQETPQQVESYNPSDDDTVGGILTPSSTQSSTDSLSKAPTRRELKAAYKAVRRHEKALYKAEKARVKAERMSNRL